ncbi:MAG: hypothetical protein QOE36_2962 [Gaiellaceae bacterium]|jgi:ADP-ribose pyrophosphatase YjhB (NUDIX family)|nr:hypothetical protein [Gaiellaceae bacterium]
MLHGWRHCPLCAGPLVHGPKHVRCETCGHVVWASAAPTAGALCVDDEGRVLLARRAHEPFQGRWDIPGGFLDEGEHPLDALRRELREETGAEVEPLAFLGVWMDWYGDGLDAQATLNLYWTAEIVSGDLEPADDVTELRWFAPDELPSGDEVAFANVPLVLDAWRQQHT